MKLKWTYLCLGQVDDTGGRCNEIFELAPLGVCPVCGSEDVFPLHRLVLSAPERAEWYGRIAGKRGKRVGDPKTQKAGLQSRP